MAVVSGLGIAAAFPTFDLEPLAWVALVPLLIATRELSPGRAFRTGWLAGFVFFVVSTHWVAYTIRHYTNVPAVVAYAILVLMVSVLACYWGAFTAALSWFERRRLPSLWLAAPVWVALEWMRAWFFIGFPWGYLGYSQYLIPRPGADGRGDRRLRCVGACSCCSTR